MRKLYPVLIAALSAAAIAGNASAAVNLVTNGSFETNGGNGQVGSNTTLSGWTLAPTPGYTFVFNAGAGVSGSTADTTGAPSVQFGTVKLWGPGDGSNNGLTESPDGGAFIAADPQFQDSPLSQSISGLTAGSKYDVTFYWAAAQQAGFDGATFDGWNVSLGGQTLTTGTVPVANHGFSGWYQTTLEFTATTTGSETLSFMAVGGPSTALPPFALLDGVSMIAVPEPTTWAFMIMGFGGIGAMVRSRRRQLAAAAA